MTDQAIEQEIQAKGLTAPRVTPADIEAEIASEHYFTALDGVLTGAAIDNATADALSLLTFCVLVLKNGFTVTGESACASPENFDAEIGRKIARENAVANIWPLLGFQLRNQLSADPEKAASPDAVAMRQQERLWLWKSVYQSAYERTGSANSAQRDANSAVDAFDATFPT